jgi:hypothetical protein
MHGNLEIQVSTFQFNVDSMSTESVYAIDMNYVSWKKLKVYIYNIYITLIYRNLMEELDV